MIRLCVLLVCASLVEAQLDAFALPQAPRYAPKPTVPPEYRSFFELDGHARELVDSLLGPRPGGLFPEKTYDIGNPTVPEGPNNRPMHVPSTLERTLEQFFTAPETPQGQALPPGFNSGFSLLNNNQALTSFSNDVRRAPENNDVEGSGDGKDSKSSIKGIPEIPKSLKLPKAPVNIPLFTELAMRNPFAVANSPPVVPTFQSAPAVPEGGFLTGDIRRAPQSVSEVASSVDDNVEDEFGGLAEETSTSSGGLIGTILKLIDMGSKKQANSTAQQPTVEDRNALGNAFKNLLGGADSPLPKNVLSSAIYKAFTSGSVTNNDTLADGEKKNETIVLTPAQTAAIGENLELIQNLIIQPTSPLCTNKPEPVEFDLAAFMGQWYQVVYSPPLSSGPCSMVAYKTLSDINSGGSGSLFEIFEYTTDGTPYGKPKISSGYALIKSPGVLIYRTTNNHDDVMVQVLNVGPLNANGQYEYAVMSMNCNFPLYVFARDPNTYKQRFETEVNEYLERSGLLNGISRLLNIVAPVDNSMCTFPPSLFNIQG